LAAWGLTQLQAKFAFHGVEIEIVADADEDHCLSARVFGLGQEIGGEEIWASGRVGDDKDLTFASHGVDVDLTVEQTLGRGDIDISWPHDFVDLGDRFCAKGERGDRLSATYLKDIFAKAK
jgi:hypothetical protein